MTEFALLPRIREITDSMGGCVRVSAESHPSGALVIIERPDERGRPRALLDGYGVEVLAGYLMAARLALPHGLPEERVDGAFATCFRLGTEPAPVLTLTQACAKLPVDLSAPVWDRLYAELCLVAAHAREMTRRASESVH